MSLRGLARKAGSMFYMLLISLGWQPKERDCDHPDAGEDGE